MWINAASKGGVVFLFFDCPGRRERSQSELTNILII